MVFEGFWVDVLKEVFILGIKELVKFLILIFYIYIYFVYVYNVSEE